MNTSATPLQLTRQKQIFLWIACYALLTVFFVLAAEVIVRINGVKAIRRQEVSIAVSPGGRFYQKHSNLGYTHVPGRFRVTLPSGYSFIATHLPNTLRITSPIDTYEAAGKKKEIWIFGCSFTHGWSLNDEETYPWLLQQRFREYEIVNFGVGGYGTIHSLIQFIGALEAKTPKVAVLAYANFHDERNVFSRSRRVYASNLWNKLGSLREPYAWVDERGKLEYSFANLKYSEFPLVRYSAFMHYIELAYNQLEEKSHRTHAVSEALIVEMARLAREHGVKFIVAGIEAAQDTLQFARENGIPAIDISVDRSISAHTNLPHDNHPSAGANKQYAAKLEPFLRTKILETAKSGAVNSTRWRAPAILESTQLKRKMILHSSAMND
jgi:hypothetical protein